MYSPKIRADLISKLYDLAKSIEKPMTIVVSDIIEYYFDNVPVDKYDVIIEKDILFDIEGSEGE